ncbi:MAG: glycerophosphoryl diester phosphodiesterase membrane domain-containing protein [Ruminococcus sp.]|nr:glycerophosphoryl diester phosphodiesterase membrane domain-containing protein [Ruminococcus sp.]
MKGFFRAGRDFVRAFPGIIAFELFFKLIITAVGLPVLGAMLRFVADNANVKYVSGETLTEIVRSPVALVSAVITLIAVGFFSITELCALTACFACQRKGVRLTLYGMLRVGLRSFAKAVKGRGILSFFAFLLFVPLVRFTVSAGIFASPFIPAVRSLLNPYGIYTAGAVMLVVTVLSLWFLSGRLYSLHYLVLTETSFCDCGKKSRKCLEGKRGGALLYVIGWSFILTLAVMLVVFAVSFVIILGIRGVSQSRYAVNSALKVISYAGKVLYAVSAVLIAPVIMCGVNDGFFRDASENEELAFPENRAVKLSKPVKYTAMAVAVMVGVMLNFSYIRNIYLGNSSFALSMFTAPQITAHRGFSDIAPENTIYAFQSAVDAGADYIELDVQQSADGQLVVIHDKTLDRTTNGTGAVSSYTYEELSKLDCNDKFDADSFPESRIMLLSEVLAFADNDILLNIEIKKTGEEIDTARKTAELVMEYGLEDSCYVTSFSYYALRAVKKACPEIKTGIISSSATATVYSALTDIDAVSLNYSFVNKSIVNTAHKNGKTVFVWTVNSEEDIERMVSVGADNIITDRPDMAIETVYSYGMADIFLVMLERIFSA